MISAPNTCSFKGKNFFFVAHSGFTLIELVLVFGIIFTVTGLSFAGFQDISKVQFLKDAALELKSNLRYAQNLAISGVKPAGCSGDLIGYKVAFRQYDNLYFISARCSLSDGPVKVYKLATSVLVSELTTVRSGQPPLTNTTMDVIFTTSGFVEFYNTAGLINDVFVGYITIYNTTNNSLTNRATITTSGGII